VVADSIKKLTSDSSILGQLKQASQNNEFPSPITPKQKEPKVDVFKV